MTHQFKFGDRAIHSTSGGICLKARNMTPEQIEQERTAFEAWYRRWAGEEPTVNMVWE